jgi:hypothetical protein
MEARFASELVTLVVKATGVSEDFILDRLLHEWEMLALAQLANAMATGNVSELQARQLATLDKVRASVAAPPDLEVEREYHEQNQNFEELRRRLGIDDQE